MNPLIRNRKLEHIDKILKDPQVDRLSSGFDRIRLIHRALPEINYDEIQTSTEFLGKKIEIPLLISSMTGGDDPQLLAINQRLAKAAQASGVAMAVGSMRIALEREAARESFALRSLAPTIPLLANLGAVQLNYGYGFDDCVKLIDILQADALILHLNPLQEAVQPEGNRNFKGLLDKIEKLANRLPVPLIVKEVGSGFCCEDIQRLQECGVKWIDIAGQGGTSWSRIEAHRSLEPVGFLYQDWGIPTAQVLTNLSGFCEGNWIASGGIRQGLDIVKSLVLGAQMAAVAKPFLQPSLESEESVVAIIETLKREVKVGMFLLGQSHVPAMIGRRDLILENGYE